MKIEGLIFFWNKLRKLPVAQSVFWLTFAQIASVGLPLITIPYLMRILGTEYYGLVLFVQATMSIFAIVLDYGYDIEGTRLVSLYRENRKELFHLISASIYLKAILVFIMFFVLLTLFFFDKFSVNASYFLLGFVFVVGNTFSFGWFFQGIEKMQYSSIFTVIGRALYTIGIFIFIKDTTDSIYVILLYSISSILIAVLSIYSMVKLFDVKLYFPGWIAVFDATKQFKNFFFSSVSTTLITNSNTVIAGAFLGNSAAGIYGAAEKLFWALTMPFLMIVKAFFPYFAKSRNIKVFAKYFTSLIGFYTIVCLLSYLFSDEIVFYVLGDDSLREISTIFKCFVVATIVSVISISIGHTLISAWGFPEITNRSTNIGGVIFIIGLFGFYFYSNIYYLVTLYLVVQIVILAIRISGILKLKKTFSFSYEDTSIITKI